MVFDSIPSAASNPKEFAKKKRNWGFHQMGNRYVRFLLRLRWSQNVVPEAEYVTYSNDSHGWRDFNRIMFWLAVMSGGLIILHILFLLILNLRKKKEKEIPYVSVTFPRFEVYLVILAVPCVSAASASLLKGYLVTNRPFHRWVGFSHAFYGTDTFI